MELSKIIDSQVSSGLSSKIYRTNINEIQPEDDKQKSELYEVNIFDHILRIAPGLTIKDGEIPKLCYCYIYVILKNKVKAKLGIVEELTDSPPAIFDISLIEDGRLRLFDVYEQNPELITELQYIQNAQNVREEPKYEGPGFESMDENVFDYMIREELPNQTSEKTIAGYENLSKQTKDATKQSKYPEEQKSIVEVLGMYKKPIVEAKKNMSEKALIILKEGVKNIRQLCASLLLLEVSLKTFNFIILDETDEVVNTTNIRAFTTFPKIDTLKYLIVKWENDMPHLIEKYSSYELLPDKYKDAKDRKKDKQEKQENKKQPSATSSKAKSVKPPVPPVSESKRENSEEPSTEGRKSTLSKMTGRTGLTAKPMSGMMSVHMEENGNEQNVTTSKKMAEKQKAEQKEEQKAEQKAEQRAEQRVEILKDDEDDSPPIRPSKKPQARREILENSNSENNSTTASQKIKMQSSIKVKQSKK